MTDLDELSRLLREATAGPWIADAWSSLSRDVEGFTLTAGGYRLPMDSCSGTIEEATANAALIAALRNSAEEWILDARACAEIRRVIALGKDDGSVGRAARRAIAQEQK